MKRALFTIICIISVLCVDCRESTAEQTIKQIVFKEIQGNGEQVVVKLSGQFYPQIFGLPGNDPRIVCDFTDTTADKAVASQQDVTGKFIRRIRVGVHTAPQRKVRVVLDLVPGLDYDVRQTFAAEENEFTVSIFQD